MKTVIKPLDAGLKLNVGKSIETLTVQIGSAIRPILTRQMKTDEQPKAER